jgi:fibronectin-binding autotransporter adhesin
VIAAGIAAMPECALAQRPLGIDVSSYQETINWTSVKGAGITFAWAKATEGLSYIDAYFTGNEANAKAAGVLIGAYHFAHPELHIGSAGADQEAAYFWNEAGSYINTNGNSYLMPVLDFEQDVTNASPAYTAATLSAWVNEWCQDIVNYGKANGVVVVPVVYTYTSYAAGTSGHGPGLNSTVTQWPLWMASPNGESAQTGAPSATSPWSTWDVWQYGQADIAGITTGVVDEDVFNGTAAALTNTLVIGKATASGGAGATVYWDPGDKNASPGSGGAGTWDTTTSDWWLSGTGDTAWSAGGDYAVFAGTAGTVSLGTLVSADGITFNTPGYVVSGSGTLMLNGTAPVISVPPGSPTYITSVVGGSGYTLSGGGVLVLENAGNYCGNSTSAEYVNGPNTCLVVLSDHDTGNDGVTLNLQNGGIYQDNDTTTGDQFLLPGCAIALLTGGGVFDNPNASLTMSNYITGPGSLTFTGYTNSSSTPYVLTLTDTGNNYSGGTIVQGPGELKANAAGTLGSTSGPLTVNGGILDLGGASHTVGAVTISAGTIQDGTLTGSSYTGQSGTVSAVLAGSGALTKNGTGQLTLSGANTFTGKISVSGTSRSIIQFGADSNLGAVPGSAVANQITLNGGVGVGLRVTGNTTINANRGITLSGTGGSVEATSGKIVYYPGIITGSGNFSSGGGVTLGYGTNVLSGANTYSGTTTITAGTLQLGANNTLPAGTALTIQADDNGTGGGGVLYLSSYNQTVGSLASSTSNGGTDTPTVNLGTGTLTVNQSSSTVFAGKITGSGTLTKSGAGTLTLSGANNYTGGTTVSGGTLEGTGAGSIPGNVNNPAGTLQLDNASAMASSANLTLASAPRAGAVNVNFAGTQNVAALYFGVTQKAAGTWAASGATHNNAAFAGSGILNVTTGPASATTLSLTSGTNPSIYGSSLTFTATVAGNAPSGTVQLIVDGLATGSPVALVGGSAPLVISTLTVPGSPNQITAAYGGDDNNNPSSTASALSQSVTPAALTVTGIGASDKAYDGTVTATLTATPGTLVGVVSGDTVTLGGTAVGTFADPNVGTNKTVTVSGLTLGGASAGNYTLTEPTTTASITAAGTITALASSQNPSSPGSNVTFTATVSSGAGTLTGNVVFLVNSVPFSTNALVGGVAAATNSTLPSGTNTVAAQYPAQGNYLGSTNSLEEVVQNLVVGSQTNVIAGITNNQDGTFTLTFLGTPQAEYYVVASSDASVAMTNWAPVIGSTNTVTNSSGIWQLTVTNNGLQQFYRSTAAAPAP